MSSLYRSYPYPVIPVFLRSGQTSSPRSEPLGLENSTEDFLCIFNRFDCSLFYCSIYLC